MSKKFLAVTLLSLVAANTNVGVALADRDSNYKDRNFGQPFQELLQKIQHLEDRIDGLEEENAELMTRLACVSGESDSTDVYFEGCNVHVRNGAGQTASVNDRGNFIVGYNEDNVGTANDRTGSHNLVVGSEHTYSSYGGLVAGLENSITAPQASVCGGQRNVASGTESSVVGGWLNEASGNNAAILGGAVNLASGTQATVSGGGDNVVSARDATVSGGRGCTIAAENAWGIGDTDVSTTGCFVTNLP